MLPDVCCSLMAVCGLLMSAGCLPSVVRCLFVGGLLCAVCCFGVRGLSFAMCCWNLTV